MLAAIASPALGPFPGAVVPWPMHGLSVALLLSAPRAQRAWIASAMALVLVAALLPDAMDLAMTVPRLVAAVALLVAQAVLITVVHERVTGGGDPLSGTTAYAAMLAAGLVGTVPLTAIASLTLDPTTPGASGYAGLAWWGGAASSCVALVGIGVALMAPARRFAPWRPARVIEAAVFVVAFAAGLASTFGEVGPLAGRLTAALATLPFLVWGGMRFGTRGFAVVGAVLVATVVIATCNELGPFGRLAEPELERLRRAWIYVASIIGSAMIFPVALAERTEADRRTRDAHAQLRAMFESSTDLIASVDRRVALVAANPAWHRSFERLSGRQVAPGMTVLEAYGPLNEDAARSVACWRRALSGERFTDVREIGDPNLAREEFEITYSPVVDEAGEIVGASQVVRNISERRVREAEEAEARRMESIGRLAGGVAHDFNNLMTAVMGYAEILGASLADDDPRRADIVEIERAAARAGNLTQQLLAFARRREVHPRVLDIGDQLRSLERLLHSILGPTIELELIVAARLPYVTIDPTQFDQIILNLAGNARDAMDGSGRLRITASEAIDGVRLTVTDSGAGMAPEVLARIFEPFYTTKPLGEGTGLGLSTVHGIVHQAGGRIDVESAVGRGTTFRVDFPRAEGSGARPAPASPLPVAPRTP